jgi:hypothetical protein
LRDWSAISDADDKAGPIIRTDAGGVRDRRPPNFLNRITIVGIVRTSLMFSQRVSFYR